MTDAHQYMHGKKFAVYGDPDQLLGYVSFLLEMGATPAPHPLQQGVEEAGEGAPGAARRLALTARAGKIYMNKDLWHLRSLLDDRSGGRASSATPTASSPPATPRSRSSASASRSSTGSTSTATRIIGYQGVINMVTEICNKFIDIKDETCDDRHFEMMR